MQLQTLMQELSNYMEYHKMTKSIPNITIINAETNTEQTREMTSEEYAVWKVSADKEKKSETSEAAEAKANATAKEAILDRLGLTADELKTILG
jgi:hypothetical protein